jgi:hypothetical protein
VDRWSLPATAGREGWPPAGAVPQGAPVTEPGVQADSSATAVDRETGDAVEHEVDLETVADRFPDYVGELRSRLGLPAV